MFRLAPVLLMAACISLAVTNPGADAHKEVVYNRVSNNVGLGGTLGEIAGGMLSNLDALPLEYHNYVLFSTMSYRDEPLSVGFFNHIRLTDWDR